MKRILALLTLIISFNSNAQTLDKNLFIQISTIPVLDQTLGSPYFDDKFTEGVVKDSKVKKSSQHLLRYNAYSDQFEVQYKTKLFAVVKNSDIIVRESKTTYVFTAFTPLFSKKIKTGYLEELEANLLYLRHVKEIKEGRESANSVAASIPDKLIIVKELYTYTEDGKAVGVKWNTKNILKVFPIEAREDMARYLKENKLKVKNIEDLRTLVKFHNDMLKSESGLALKN
ncbi:MAG: hypothetical protein ACPGR7_09000 [Flavobacteriaceae bacterium]